MYTNCIRASSGFSHEVDKQLMQAVNTGKYPGWQISVVVLMDEMYIRERLVYNKYTGEIVGFADLGDVNNHLIELEESKR